MTARAIAMAMLLCACLPSYRTVPPPVSRSMQASLATGPWQSTFGDVTIANTVDGRVTGSWTYVDPDSRQEVGGFFHGTLQGTVLQLSWTEGMASGFGFLEFAPDGETFSGRWWNAHRTKTGIWRGWRRSEG